MIIYKITNTINNKVYVGQTIKQFKVRWSQHLSCKHKDRFHDAIRKYGRDAWSFETLDVLDASEPIDLLHHRERYWIKHFDATNKERGYNLTEGGEGGVPTEETRRKIGESGKGRVCSPENRLKKSIANKGKPMSEEQKALRRIPKPPRTPEHCKAISDAKKGKRRHSADK